MDRANNQSGSQIGNKKDTYNQEETAKIPSRHNKEELVNLNPQRPYWVQESLKEGSQPATLPDELVSMDDGTGWGDLAKEEKTS